MTQGLDFNDQGSYLKLLPGAGEQLRQEGSSKQEATASLKLGNMEMSLSLKDSSVLSMFLWTESLVQEENVKCGKHGMVSPFCHLTVTFTISC